MNNKRLTEIEVADIIEAELMDVTQDYLFGFVTEFEEAEGEWVTSLIVRYGKNEMKLAILLYHIIHKQFGLSIAQRFLAIMNDVLPEPIIME